MNKFMALLSLSIISNFTVAHAGSAPGEYCNGGDPLPPMCVCAQGKVRCTFNPPSPKLVQETPTSQQKVLIMSQ